MRTRNPSPDDRSVSEVISFTLIFSLIAATVVLVYVSGIGGLEASRSAERITNAERAFDVLDDNINDIHSEGSPSRATEIKVSDAQMEFGDSVRVTLRVENLYDNRAETTNLSTVTIDPIVYSAMSGPQLVYSNGGVFRQDRGGTIRNSDPSLLFTNSGGERTAILPTIQTRQAGVSSTGSQRTILVRTLLATREVAVAEDDPDTLMNDPDGDGSDEFSDADLNPDGSDENSDGTLDPEEQEYSVTIRLTTSEERRDVWLDYLNNQIPDSQDVRGTVGDGIACEAISPTAVECSLAVENIYSTVTRIDVTYD